MIKAIYRPLATMALGLCLVANLVLIAGLGAVWVDLLLMPANDPRNLGLVVMALFWGYALWTMVEFVHEIPTDFHDIWR